jgi:hypothetical protein
MDMKKIIAIVISISIFSCSPYQRMFLSPANLNSVLEDSCDMLTITSLKQLLDTIEFDNTTKQNELLEDLINDPECKHYTYKLFPPKPEDSTIWLTTIRPVLIGKDEIILGNLYTFKPNQDSIFIFQRRMKEYSQKADFESGKYVVFTYFVENDTTTIIKVGTRMF